MLSLIFQIYFRSKCGFIRIQAGFSEVFTWEQRKLGELAEFSKGQGYTKSDLRESGIPIILYGRLYTKYQPIIREVDTFADATPQAVFSKGGEVILPSSGETAEDIAIAASVDKSGFLLGGGLNIVLPHKEIDSAFLAIEISFGTPHTELAKRAQGKSVVHLYNEDLKAVEISYPTIAEQKQISTLFDSFDNLITLHQRMCVSFGCTLQIRKDSPLAFAWEQRKLEEYLSVSSEKNADDAYDKTDVLSVSGDYGIVNQIEFQGRSFAGVSVSNYGVVRTGDVVYTKSPLNSNPYGIIKTNKGKTGIVSTLYAVYRPKENTYPDFVQTYFEQHARMNNYMHPLVNKGAKNDMKVSSENALKGYVIFPNYEEQKAISEYFAVIDDLITLHQRKQKADINSVM